MQAMTAATAGSNPLPSSCYDLCFPVLEAVLTSAVHTSLHEQALQVLALHVDPSLPIPRKKTLAVLYHVLGVVPAYRLVSFSIADGMWGVSPVATLMHAEQRTHGATVEILTQPKAHKVYVHLPDPL